METRFPYHPPTAGLARFGAQHREPLIGAPVAEHTLAMWHDLNQLTYGAEALRFISLFDDTTDVWQDEDLTLLDSLSEVRRWSEPEALIEALEAAA